MIDCSKIQHGDRVTILKVDSISKTSSNISGIAVMKSVSSNSWIIRDDNGRAWIASPKNIVGVKHL